MIAWIKTFNWWELHFFLPLITFVSLSVIGALILSVVHRADDIYNNRRSDYTKYWAFMLWMFSIPYFIIEMPAQLLAKYKEYKKNKKFSKVA